MVAQHRVQDGEESAQASRESHFLLFATFQEMLVLSLNEWVMAPGHERGHVEHTAYIGSASHLGVNQLQAEFCSFLL